GAPRVLKMRSSSASWMVAPRFGAAGCGSAGGRTMISFWVMGLVLIMWAPAPQGRRENKTDYYKKWLEEDVVYISTGEEQAVFSKLTTPEEKDRFIEQFWQRRDPDPSTEANEFKEEHYRRLQYANKKFAAGKPGWRTDRGR